MHTTLGTISQYKRWLLWTDKDGRKIPHYLNRRPRGVGVDGKVQLDTPEDWEGMGTLDEAKALAVGGYKVGLALGPIDDGKFLQGIDLDKIGSQNPHLKQYEKTLPGYVERSPSGDGLHAIGIGKSFRGKKKGGVEAYCAGRFFTFTGDVIRDGVVTDLTPIIHRTATH